MAGRKERAVQVTEALRRSFPLQLPASEVALELRTGTKTAKATLDELVGLGLAVRCPGGKFAATPPPEGVGRADWLRAAAEVREAMHAVNIGDAGASSSEGEGRA